MALQAKLCQRFTAVRTFVNAKVKWVRDPYLDFVVEREKDLRPALAFKHQILSSSDDSSNHPKTLPLSVAALLKPRLALSVPSLRFFQKYPSFFTVFQPGPGLPPSVRLTGRARALHAEESAARAAARTDAAERLARVLMLARASRAPIRLIERLGWDLGLSGDFVTSLLADFPDYFQICEVRNPSSMKSELALELVSWRNGLALSELERRRSETGAEQPIAFPMILPRGFDLGKKVKLWLQQWQTLPYISPYEDAFHLAPSGDQAEKWTVAVLHELLWLTVSKKTESENLISLGEWLGFRSASVKKALVQHPGIFYVSNKLRTQTVVLREAYRKDFLVEKHPLMAMRYRYMSLLNSRIRSLASANSNRHTC